MFFVYLLRCRDNSLYCGQTNNLKKRVGEHNSSKHKSAKYTKIRRPVVLVYAEQFDNRLQAMRRERLIKKLTKKRKEILILKKTNSGL